MPWLLAAVFLLAGALCEAAEVKNLKGWMEGDLGVISYDLVGNLGERQADVSVYLEISGNRYRADQLSLKGDYGEKVAVGREKRFTWDILKDFPAGFEGDTIWDVTASGSPEAVVALPPPRIEQAPRPATTTTPIEETFTRPTLGAEFVLIPAGTFMMGSPSGFFGGESGRDPDETQHKVTISRPFYMQTTEVTQGQWQKVMGSNPSQLNSCGDDCPVETVSWNDVQEFIRKLNSMEGTERYRLPTEAQWEFAARAGTTTRFHTGNSEEDLSRAGWYGGNSGFSTHPVGQKTSNAWGLYDMHGNVFEWVQDWKGGYPAGSVIDPEGPSSGTGRVVRGGSGYGLAGDCRSAFRDDFDPVIRVGSLGFRLLRTDAAADFASKVKSTSVSGPRETDRDGRFIAYDNGTVLDKNTNLMWAAKDNGSDINWANAKSYCENYRGGGYTDWRMPTQDELAGLYDTAKTYKSESGYDVHLTELIRLTRTWAWASETRGSAAAGFSFYDGERSWLHQSYASFIRALPVRSGK